MGVGWRLFSSRPQVSCLFSAAARVRRGAAGTLAYLPIPHTPASGNPSTALASLALPTHSLVVAARQKTQDDAVDESRGKKIPPHSASVSFLPNSAWPPRGSGAHRMAAGGRGKLAAAAADAAPAAVAGAAADEVVHRVRPTEASERRRAEVVDYARRLVGSALGCEVRFLNCACARHTAVRCSAGPLPSARSARRGDSAFSLCEFRLCFLRLGGNRLVIVDVSFRG